MAAIRIRLDNLLKERGITRYELSKRTGIGFQTIDCPVRQLSIIKNLYCFGLRN